ncbi:reverse transcriptase domain-containing protein [Tanacetum coccineum]
MPHSLRTGPVVEPSTTPRRHRNKKHSQQVDPAIVEKPVVTMAGTRFMAELLPSTPPPSGYGESHAHIRWFNKIILTIKYKDVPNSSIKLILFPPDLAGKRTPSITNLRNEITNFQQRFDESFCEAWERFKDLLRACPHHAADVNLLTKTPKDALTLIENKSKGRTSRNRPVVAKVSTNTSTSGLSPDVTALTDAVKTLLLKSTTPPSASVKEVEKSCVTCGGPHPYYKCLATDGNASGYQDNIQAYVSATAINYNQGNAGHHPPSVAQQVRPPGFPPVHNNQNRGNNYNPGNSNYRAPTPPAQDAPSNELVNYMKVNETNMRAMKNQITNMKTELKNEFQATMLQQNNKLEIMLGNYFQMNKPLSSGLLPSNTITNPKGDLKAITTRSGVSYDGPLIPPHFSSYPKVGGKGAQVQSTTRPTGIAEDVFVRVGNFHFPADFVVVDHVVDPRVPLILGRPFLRMARALIDVYGEELTLRVSDKAITFKVGFSDNSESGNPTLISKPIIAKSSPSLTPFEGGDFILEEIEACFASDSVPIGIDETKFDLEGDIRLIEEMLNKDLYSPLPPKDLKFEELKTIKSSVDEPPELELKDLPSHLKYAFLERTNKLPVIIAKNLKDEEKVLKSHKQVIA